MELQVSYKFADNYEGTGGPVARKEFYSFSWYM